MLAWTLTIALSGCSGDDVGFGGSGNRYENTDTDDSEPTETEDTENPYGDWPQPYDPNGPSLGTMDAWFDEYPNIGDIIYVQVAYFDPQDDLLNGRFKVWVEADDGTVDGTSEGDIKETTSGSADAWIEDDKLEFVIAIENEWIAYFLKLRAWDKKNNRSNDLEGSVAP